MRGFLLPLLEAAVVVLVLLLIFFEFPSSHNTKVNKKTKENRAKLACSLDGQWRSEVSETRRIIDLIHYIFCYFTNLLHLRLHLLVLLLHE